MAIPFNLPNEEGASQNLMPPSRNVNNPPPQFLQIDSEMLVQAYLGAFHRYTEDRSPPNLPPICPITIQEFSQIFAFSTPPTSSASTPRSSFRHSGCQRRRRHSFSGHSHFNVNSPSRHENEQEEEQTTQQVPNNQKKPTSNKLTNFVINALQFVIDTFK